jgi:outer membrane protein assembly factor BamA
MRNVLRLVTCEPTIRLMRAGTILRFALPSVVCCAFYLPPTCAQLPKKLERCLPYPTYAQEIRDMDEEIAAKMKIEVPQRVVIDEVAFDGPIHISDSDRQQLITRLKQGNYTADYDWLSDVQEIGIKGMWRDRGYFKVEATAKVEIVRKDSAGEHVSIIVHVDEGAQYRLGSVQFRSSDPDDPLVFPPEELRKLIPMNEGDIFSADKIRKSLDALRDLYGSDGYIDFVAAPLTEIDDGSEHRISLVMELAQQKQFRLAKIEVFGPNPAVETLLKSKLKPGDAYNWKAIEDFLKENKVLLPPNISPEDLELRRNVKDGTVDLRFNFAARFNFETCSQFQD